MIKRIAIAGFLGLVLTAALVHAGDAPFVEGVDGRPADFQKGDKACYGVWHEKGENRWVIGITTAGHRHHFKGRIWIEGAGHFKDPEVYKGWGERKAEWGEENWFFDRLHKTDGGQELTFDLVSEGGHVSAFAFKVPGDGILHWDLTIGGPDEKDWGQREPGRVKVGSDGKNPPEVPFKTYAHPNKAGHGK
jgi:hypothetical protein